MRVALLAPEFIPCIGGAGIYAVNLVREISKYPEIEMHIITPKRGKNTEKEIEKLFDNRIKIHFISEANDTFFYNFKFQIALGKKFEKLNKKFRFDIIHSTGLVHMPDIFIRKQRINVPFITTVHTSIDSQFDYKFNFKEFARLSHVSEYLSFAAYPYIKFMQQKNIKKTSNFICVSKYVSKYIPKNKNISIINNGVDSDKFKPASIKNKNSNFKELDKIKIPKILYCGRFLYLKGIGNLIKAAKELLKTHKAHFVFIGDGNSKIKNKLIKNIGKKNITLLGFIDYDKINLVYQKCNIFVLPSLIESFPYTLLEAMSSGLAAAVSNTGGIPEIIKDNYNGMMFDPYDSDSLKKKLEILLDDTEKRKILGQNARKTVLENYTAKKMADKTRDVYKKLEKRCLK